MFRIAWVSPVHAWHLRSSQHSRAVLAAHPGCGQPIDSRPPAAGQHSASQEPSTDTTSAWDIEVFVDSADWDALRKDSDEDGADVLLASGQAVFQHHRLLERHEALRFDAVIVHLEDSLEANFTRLVTQGWPCIVLAHDINLNQLLQALYRYTTAPTELNQFWQKLFGEHAPPVGDYHIRKWPAEVFDRSFSSGIGPQQSGTRLCFFNAVHTETLERQVGRPQAEARMFDSLIEVFDPDRAELQERRLRSELEIGSDELVVAFNPSRYLADQVHRSLEGVAAAGRRLAEQGKRVRLLWLTCSPQEHALYAEQAPRFTALLAGGTVSVTKVAIDSAEAFAGALSLADVVLAVRVAADQALPLALSYAIQLRRPALAADFGPSAELDRRAVCLLPVGFNANQIGIEHWIQQCLVEFGSLSESEQAAFSVSVLRTPELRRLSSENLRLQAERFWKSLAQLLESQRNELAHALQERQQHLATVECALLELTDGDFAAGVFELARVADLDQNISADRQLFFGERVEK